MNKLDLDYQNLLKDILDNGTKKRTRNGEVLSVFGKQIRHKMSAGFPLLTSKKMYFKGILVELLWFLKGDTNIKYLLDNDCHIWDGDCYKSYVLRHNFIINQGIEILSQEEFIDKIKTDNGFAEVWGDLGRIYGKQWRRWKKVDEVWDENLHPPFKIENIELIDQIQNLIKDLRTNPDSRRLIVNAWNVGELDNMVLPPCHYGFQVYTRELSLYERINLFMKGKKVERFLEKITIKDLDDSNIPTRSISLMFNTRSQDVPLGTPFNIASYGLLLEIIAKMVNMVPDELINNMGDCHIYVNQIDGVKEQLTRDSYPLPKLIMSDKINFNEGIDEFLNSCSVKDFFIEGYQSHSKINIPLSN
jgi:thymidylate synthase